VAAPQTRNAKAAAVDTWTADPCGSNLVSGEPGTREYLEELLAMRAGYGPWMEEELAYESASGLDVLDVGCGQGIDLVQYALAGARPIGVDLTPRHVQLARAHLASMGFEPVVLEGDAEALPFDDQSFDRASSNGVLHHTSDMSAALREIRRVLRPGGNATVIVYNRNSLHYWLHQVLVRGVLFGGLVRERSMEGVLSSGVEYSRIGARPLVRVYTRRRLRRMMLDAGFTGVSVHARHFRPTDTVLTSFLSRFIASLRDRRFLDRIGRRAGWYLVAKGSRPTASGADLAERRRGSH
jgi:ubiquinone/menaquinone biosynthesis C-methylase UbiE